jgi:predicted secreted protein
VAIIFGLAVNFGDDRDAAQRARQLVQTARPIQAGDRSTALHPPFVHDTTSADGTRYIEFTVVPVGVGWGVPRDAGVERAVLDRIGLSALGHGLYALLSRMEGYQVAQVDWDPERFVDLAELRAGWSEDLTQGDMPGLVLSTEARRSLQPTTGFEPFGDHHEWIPYRGERSGNEG